MTSQLTPVSLSLLAFVFEVSAVSVDGFWYASSPVQAPRIAAVGESAAAAVSYWCELYRSGALGA